VRQQVTVRLNSCVLRDMMARQNLSQDRLARRLRISSTFLSQLLAGRRNPSPAIRQRILDALEHYNFDDLFVIGDRTTTGASGSEACPNG
jgi:transcriptional regulator with XRE-family HTH domain